MCFAMFSRSTYTHHCQKEGAIGGPMLGAECVGIVEMHLHFIIFILHLVLVIT